MRTSSASKKRSKKSSGKAASRRRGKAPTSKRRAANSGLGRPFEASVLRRAKKIALTYRLVFEPEPELGFLGRSVEMPFVMGDGKTIQTCAEQTIDALVTAIATLLESGEQPPSAASAGKRDRQVNVRMTADEKMRLEEVAQREGFRSVSDFIRAAAMSRAS